MTPPPTVEILAIGNELLRGEILDTNTQWLCRLVTARGGRVGRVTLLPDVEAEIAAAVRAAIERRVAVLFTSGGLGPTDDDLTLAAVARGAGVALVLNEQARTMVRASYNDFHARGIIFEPGLNPFREKMARLPAGAEPLDNPVGTAPGVLLRAGVTAIISLPGVPPELEAIVSQTLAPFLDRTFGSGASASRMLKQSVVIAPGELFSLHGLLFRLGYVVTGPLVGWVSDRQGLSTGFLVLAASFSLLLPLAGRSFLREHRAAEAGQGGEDRD